MECFYFKERLINRFDFETDWYYLLLGSNDTFCLKIARREGWRNLIDQLIDLIRNKSYTIGFQVLSNVFNRMLFNL